jgi:hypothetical protein
VGNVIRIDAVANPDDMFCIQILMPWSFTVTVGPLPAGFYTVEVYIARGSQGEPILHHTTSFLVRREEVSGFITVVDEDDEPIAGATVYADGQPIGVTDQDGLLDHGSLEMGIALVALAQQAEQPTSREAHDGWAYRTFLSSLTLDAEGDPQPSVVSGPGEQRLVVRQDSPLVLSNLLVSIEWDADVTYTEEISRAVQFASDYLYDITDAQMAFGQVAIYDNAEHWTDSDIRISASNIVRPHAYVGGINSADPAHTIRLGRGWDGNSGNQGPWDQPEGYRTLIHQFGHYALYLYEEYFGYVFNQGGNPIGQVPAYCTGPENRNPATEATNGSIMDYQYTTTELSARGVPGLWSDLCEQTAQWQLNDESAWETVVRMYTDTVSPPRWQFTTPIERGSVLTGPTSLPSDILALPLVEVHQTGTSPPPRRLTVYGPQGPDWGASVSLHKQDGQVIEQGLTDSNGQLNINGAVEGDTVQAVSSDRDLEGSVTVGTATNLTLVLKPRYKIYLPVVVK